MSAASKTGSVQLADQSASTILHRTLAEAVAAFPAALAKASLPEDPQIFRQRYVDVLPRFEAARLASSERSEIARTLSAATGRRLLWEGPDGAVPLAHALEITAAPLALDSLEPCADPGWEPQLVYRGERWSAAQIPELGDRLMTRHVITPAAAEALTWLAENRLQQGAFTLSGRRIVMLGANAEMAPTRAWLEAGAEVLWLDVVPPPSDWLESFSPAGRLSWPREGSADLLTAPQAILATIVEFADGRPVDLGLYAYAPGQAREMRLTGAMNAIVDAVPRELIASVTMLVSPTTPTSLTATEQELVIRRRQSRPVWEAMLAATGLLGRGGGYEAIANAAATRTVVSIQGASYQAAQYLGKIMTAECWASHGAPDQDAPHPLRVSANSAAITRTRSLDHPVFAAAFGGAGAFGVESFTPRQSRAVNGMLAVRDWLHPETPVPGAVRVHGGLHTLPYPLESALRIAAVFGFARSPRLLRGLLQR
ncbi:MAG: hypothetical protein RIC56_11085 [Pseudomonadales bacterium]